MRGVELSMRERWSEFDVEVAVPAAPVGQLALLGVRQIHDVVEGGVDVVRSKNWQRQRGWQRQRQRQRQTE